MTLNFVFLPSTFPVSMNHSVCTKKAIYLFIRFYIEHRRQFFDNEDTISPKFETKERPPKKLDLTLQMTIEEKGKYYKCGSPFVTLDSIPAWRGVDIKTKTEVNETDVAGNITISIQGCFKELLVATTIITFLRYFRNKQSHIIVFPVNLYIFFLAIVIIISRTKTALLFILL